MEFFPDSPPPIEAILSPCIGICQLDTNTKRCVGCHRSTEQIAAWPYMTERERFQAMAKLDDEYG